MTRNQHLLFWAGPFMLILALIMMNYSHSDLLQDIVAPDLNREFGLLENLQLLAILLISIVLWKGVRKKQHWIDKLGFFLLFLFSILIFLEELDYGLHYFELIVNDGFTNKEMVRNIHNQGDNLFYIKQGLYVLLATLFVILPLAGKRIKNPLVQYLSVSPMIISTLAVYLVTGLLARHYHHVFDLPVNQSLWGNHQEFEELMVYYLFFLYVREIVNNKGEIPLFKPASGEPT